MNGRLFFKRFSFLLSLIISFVSILPKNTRKSMFVCFRNVTGKKGILIRYILIKNLVKSCGSNVAIRETVIIESLENIEFGNNVSIHPFCYVDAQGGVKIGDNVSVAHNTSILSFNHTWNNKKIPIKYNELVSKPVHIENDVWIGCGCRILSGVTIHSRAIIAAGSVVTKNVVSNSLVAGVPAKFIKSI